MLSRESFQEKSRGWKVEERPGWTIGWTATKGLSEPLLLDGENVRRLKLRAMSYEKDVVMRRHGVVMGPQAVCAVTAGLSGPGGDNGYWWRAGQRLRRTANFKPTPKSALPFSKQHTQRKGGIASQQNILTSPPRPRSPPQRGCSRRQRRRKLGREFPPGFALQVQTQRRRGGTSDCPQGSSWATIQFNSSLKSNLCEKQNPFCEDRQAVLSLGKPLFQPPGRWGSSTSGEGGEERQRGLHVDYWLLIDYRGKVWF